MKQIQDESRLYSFFLPLVSWMFRHSYRRLRYIGEENIPSDGSIIFAPNHTNALQDALAVLSINSERKVFVARADIFRRPFFAKILNFLKIMPIRRKRDGAGEVLQNDETEERAIDVLQDGVPFCILPEGTHRPKHSLLPLGKGIFRIALRANDRFGHEKSVYIVPVGLEYSDYFHLWDTLIINVGKPINVTQFVAEHSELERPQLIMALREELTMRMREQILWVPDDQNYEENLRKLRENPPKPFHLFPKHRVPAWLLFIALVLLSPLFVISAVFTFPLWLMWIIIRWSVKDPAFHNSVQFVWQLIVIPLTGFLTLPFWMFFQEYMYLVRKFKNGDELE
jgi:1-acyl-sn-glycerol-3-phosphate acyltransferase